MAKTHRVLRRISGVEHLTPGDLVDVTGWKLLDKLVDQRYLEKLTEAEITAMTAAEAAKIEKSLPTSPPAAATVVAPVPAAAKPPQAAQKPTASTARGKSA